MRRLEALLRDLPELRGLLDQARDVQQLQILWAQVVPPILCPHTRAGSLKHRRITVFADNGAVAAKLIMLSASLLKNLQNKGLEVTSIRVEVQVQSRAATPERAPRRISAQAASSLTGLADSLPDSALQNALKKLARHT